MTYLCRIKLHFNTQETHTILMHRRFIFLFVVLYRRNTNKCNHNVAFIELTARRHHVSKSVVMQKGNVKLQGSSPSSVCYLLLTRKEKEKEHY